VSHFTGEILLFTQCILQRLGWVFGRVQDCGQLARLLFRRCAKVLPLVLSHCPLPDGIVLRISARPTSSSGRGFCVVVLSDILGYICTIKGPCKQAAIQEGIICLEQTCGQEWYVSTARQEQKHLVVRFGS
jgi:hypothetical protein